MRHAANLWRIKQLLHERWVGDLGARAADGPIIDGFPIAVCKLARAVRSQVLKAEADYGYCAAKRGYYYGLKAHLLIDLRGVAVGVTITPANVDERDAAYDVLGAIEGLVLGDKGDIRPQFKADCAALGIDLPTPVRRNMKAGPAGGSSCCSAFASGSKPSSANSSNASAWRKPGRATPGI